MPVSRRRDSQPTVPVRALPRDGDPLYRDREVAQLVIEYLDWPMWAEEVDRSTEGQVHAIKIARAIYG